MNTKPIEIYSYKNNNNNDKWRRTAIEFLLCIDIFGDKMICWRMQSAFSLCQFNHKYNPHEFAWNVSFSFVQFSR